MPGKATEETAVITTQRYRGTDGKPTCARDFSTGKLCEFLMSKHFGTKQVCFYDLTGKLFYRKDADGKPTFITPSSNCCRVWPKEDLTEQFNKGEN